MQRLILFLMLLATFGLVAGGSRDRTRSAAGVHGFDGGTGGPPPPGLHAFDGGTGGPPPSFP